MASPIKDAKLKAQQIWPGAAVHSRGKGFIKHQHPTNPNRFMLDTQVGGIGWHFGDGPFTDIHEVDTAWVDADPILDAPWQKKMVLADYNAYAFREATLGFDQGQLIEYRDPVSGETVNFQPTQLQWTNDIDQISSIADPQAVAATIDDDMLTWVNAYGPGIDFQWETQTARLMKYVNINSLAELGSPPQFIIDGGNPVLRVELIFQKSLETEIWVDGVIWDEKSNNTQVTSNNVEFRLASTGETVWWFKAPKAWGSGEENNQISPTMRLRASAQNLFIEILTPWLWLETATYPVTVDATVDYQVGANADDAFEKTGVGTDITPPSATNDDDDEWTGMRFTGVTIPSGATINADTYLDFCLAVSANLDEPYHTFYAEDSATPPVFSSTPATNISDRTPTTATITFGDGSALGMAVDDWYSTYAVCYVQTIIAELELSYDYSSGLAMVFVTTCVTTNGQDDFAMHMYEGSTTLCPKLHIDYTAGGTPYYGSVSDTVGITDTISKSVGRIVLLSDPVGIVDVLSKIGTFLKSISDSVGITDTISKAGTFLKSISDAVGLTDTLTTAVEKVVSLADSIGITDVIEAIKVAATASIELLVWMIDGAPSVGEKFATIADTIGITDSLATIRDIVIDLAEAVGITDILSTVGTYIRSLPESVGITDVISKTGTFIRNIADNIGITDVITAAVFKLVALADTVGITDAITKAIGRIVALVDAVGITDIISKVGTFIRSLTEPVGITDVIATAIDKIIALADTVGITDAINAAVFKLVSLADTVGITDVLSLTGTYVRALTESVGVTDVLSKTGTFIKAVSDSVGITDVLSTSVGRVVALVDSVGITDIMTAIKGAAGYFVNLYDTVGITDTITKTGTFIRSIADSISITDVLSKIGTFIKSLTDSVGITDTISTLVGRIVALADTVGVTDVLSTSRGLIISIANAVGITDIISKVGTFIKSISDTIGITDETSIVGTFIRSISDAVGITDVLTSFKVIIVSLADTIGITDAIGGVVTQIIFFINLVDDTLKITPIINKTMRLTGNISTKVMKLTRDIAKILRL